MIYKSNFGLYNLFVVWFYRIILTAILIMIIPNFDQNPDGLSILILIVLIMVASIKTDHLIVTDKSIEIRRRIFYDILPIVTIIPKDKVKEIRITGNRKLGNNLIQYIIPFGVKLKNQLIFKLNDDKIKSFKTDIFIEELELFKEYCEKAHNSK